jgi:NitT/TauT family transport system permease protein
MNISFGTFQHVLLRWSGVIIFLALWEIAPRLEWIDPYFVPSLTTVLGSIGELFQEGVLISHLLISLWRGLLGLIAAILIGIPVGITLGWRFPLAAEVLNPILRVLSQVNPFSLLPIFILCFGIGETAKIAVVGWVSLWPVVFYTITAVRSVEPVQIKSARAFGISETDLLVRVIFPASLPLILVGVRIGAGLTFYILVAAEMLGASAGLGWLVHNSAMNYQIPRIYAGATFIVLLGYLLNRGLMYVERTLFDWREAFPGMVRDKTPQLSKPWFTPRFAAAALAGLMVLVVIAGSVEVYRANLQGGEVMPAGGHGRHFGQPVGE